MKLIGYVFRFQTLSDQGKRSTLAPSSAGQVAERAARLEHRGLFLAFAGAISAEEVGQRVVAFVAGVFIDRPR